MRKRNIPYDFTHMWNPMNKLNQQAKQRQTHRQRADDSYGGGQGVEGLSKEEKGLVDMDDGVVIAGGGEVGIRGQNGTGKKQLKK